MKTGGKSAGYFLIVIGIVVFAGIFIYSYSVSENTTEYFNPAKRGTAQKLYETVMGQDLEQEYPKTAEEVMQVNLDIISLIYGNMIIEDSIFEQLVTVQRGLFGDEILAMNSFESQYEHVMEAVEVLKDYSLNSVDIQQKPIIYDPYDNKLCYIRVEQYFNDRSRLYWEYELKRQEDDNRWKITRWARMDENFEKEIIE